MPRPLTATATLSKIAPQPSTSSLPGQSPPPPTRAQDHENHLLNAYARPCKHPLPEGFGFPTSSLALSPSWLGANFNYRKTLFALRTGRRASLWLSNVGEELRRLEFLARKEIKRDAPLLQLSP